MIHRYRLTWAWIAVAIIPFGLSRDMLTLESGETLHGVVRGKEAGFVLVELPSSEGQVFRRIAPGSIDRIDFSDTESIEKALLGDSPLPDASLIQLESAALRRAPLIGNLQMEDESILIRFLNELSANERPLEALAYGKIWRDQLVWPEHRTQIQEMLISASLAAELHDEAAIHAEVWIQMHPSPESSALAWHVLAETNLRKGDAEAALWIALHPIAHFQAPSPRYLDLCYESAAKAAEALGSSTYAAEIRSEGRGEASILTEENREIPEALFAPPSIFRPNPSFLQLLKSTLPIDQP